MLDRHARQFVDPMLNAAAAQLARAGIGANAVTLAGLVPAFAAGWAISAGNFSVALALIAINRIGDGLDGAVARTQGKSEFGGYLDSLSDYVFYLAVPIGFALASPANRLAALVLIASFTLTAVSFLAFAAIISARGEGAKSFHYQPGIAEGTETIIAFALMCLLPDQFALIAFGFAAMCGATVVQRLMMAHRAFR